jgi:hypothetical protein
MSNRLPVDAVSARAKRDILECDACYRHDDEYVLCGWHENVVAAFAIVQKTYGTMIEEPDDV